ncbi:hypothetical protein CR513_23624, partial [Mucuna pruriens]
MEFVSLSTKVDHTSIQIKFLSLNLMYGLMAISIVLNMKDFTSLVPCAIVIIILLIITPVMVNP